MRRKEKTHKGILLISLVPAGTGLILLLAAKKIVGFAQWYSVNVYSLITGTVGRLFGSVSFSVAEVLVIVLPLLIIADIVICRNRLRAALTHIILIASFLFFLYAANCGVNYYRDPFVDSEALANASFTEEQLKDFCEYVVSRINDCGDAADYPQGSELAKSARSSMYKLSGSEPSLKGYYPVPKQTGILSGFFSGMGVSGIYSPFTVEANVNGQMPDIEKPFTACHELSHLRGFMNEGEANYIGWLACIGSDDPSFRRDGWLIAWIYAGNTLNRVDPEEYAGLYEMLPEKAVEEIKLNSRFWAVHENRSSEIQDRVNDAYLKANGQAEGIQSYGMLTTLMLMWYCQ